MAEVDLCVTVHNIIAITQLLFCQKVQFHFKQRFVILLQFTWYVFSNIKYVHPLYTITILSKNRKSSLYSCLYQQDQRDRSFQSQCYQLLHPISTVRAPHGGLKITGFPSAQDNKYGFPSLQFQNTIKTIGQTWTI